jgi:hypothetical protein
LIIDPWIDHLQDHPMGRNPYTLVHILGPLHSRSGVAIRHALRKLQSSPDVQVKGARIDLPPCYTRCTFRWWCSCDWPRGRCSCVSGTAPPQTGAPSGPPPRASTAGSSTQTRTREATAASCQGTFREHSGNIQGTFGEDLVRVERTPVSLHPNCKKHLKKVPRLTQNTTRGRFREHSV